MSRSYCKGFTARDARLRRARESPSCRGQNVWFVAAICVGLALIATLLAIRLRLPTARSEIVVGTVAADHRHRAGDRGAGRPVLLDLDFNRTEFGKAILARGRRHLI